MARLVTVAPEDVPALKLTLPVPETSQVMVNVLVILTAAAEVYVPNMMLVALTVHEAAKAVAAVAVQKKRVSRRITRIMACAPYKVVVRGRGSRQPSLQK